MFSKTEKEESKYKLLVLGVKEGKSLKILQKLKR